MLSIKLLEQRREELEAEYALLSEKIARMRKERITQTDINAIFKLEKEIKKAEDEREQIERAIEINFQSLQSAYKTNSTFDEKVISQEYKTEMTERLRQFFLNAIANNPQERQTAQEILKALREALHQNEL